MNKVLTVMALTTVMATGAYALNGVDTPVMDQEMRFTSSTSDATTFSQGKELSKKSCGKNLKFCDGGK